MAAAADHVPDIHPVRIPHLGARGMPGRPGRRASRPAKAITTAAPAQTLRSGTPPQPRALRPARSSPRGETKTASFLALVTEQHGPLAAIPLDSVSKISAAAAPQVGLNTGSARTALRRAVLAAQNGDPR